MYAAFESFEQTKRPSEMSIVKYITNYEEVINQLKAVDIELPDSLLAFRLLKSANLDEESRRVVRATCKELKLADMKKALLNIFEARFDFVPTCTGSSSSFEPTFVKEEPVYEAQAFNNSTIEVNDTYECSSRGESSYRGKGRFNSRSRAGERFKPYKNTSPNKLWRSNANNAVNEPWRNNDQRSSTSRSYQGGNSRVGTNRIDRRTGQPSQCHRCGSVYHFASNCPRIEDQQSGRNSAASSNSDRETYEVNFNTLLLDEK